MHQEFGQYNPHRFIRSKVHLLWFRKPGGNQVWNIKEMLEPSMRLRSGDKRVKTAKHKGMRPFLDVWTGNNGGCRATMTSAGVIIRTSCRKCIWPGLFGRRPIPVTGFVIFLGSGTTPVVARALGRNFIGTELVSALAASAWKRVSRGPVRDVKGPLYAGPTKFD